MKLPISVIMMTKNAADVIDLSLKSVIGWADEIIVVDDESTDGTKDIARKYNAKIYSHHEVDLGKQRQYALEKATKKWVLVLDSDERLGELLAQEIATLHNTPGVLKSGYLVPFQTHFLGRPLHHGGENYKKMVFFQKDKVRINPALVHEKYEIIKGVPGILKNPIYHYSYRSLFQVFRKFTDYAYREARQKYAGGEQSSLKKIILYPLHMFWSRFVTDQGYKDGLIRIPLDLGFAYMEFMTYLSLLVYNWIKPNANQ
jgi:glycosyltransferase involved in cell wall biosynthesis